MAMATPLPDAVAMFMRITGAPEFVAVQRLEEYGGNLNEAVNAHFIQADSHISSSQRQNLVAAPQHNYSDANNPNRAGSGGMLTFLSAARRFRPSLLLDPNYRRELRGLYNGISSNAFNSHAPNNSHPGGSGDVPSPYNSAFELTHHQSGLSSAAVDMDGNFVSHGPGIYATDVYQNSSSLAQSNTSHVHDNDIEEAMIQAAIEASKKESGEGSSFKQFAAPNGSFDGGLPQSHFHQDEDLARAISLSLKTAEQEEAMREDLVKQKKEGLGVHDLLAKGEKTNSSRSRMELGTSNVAQDAAQPVLVHPLNHNAGGHIQGNEAFISDQWDGISAHELNEALMLETALFGETPIHSSHKISSLPDLQHNQQKTADPKMQCLSNPKLQLSRDTQLLRQQQDADYLASLHADKHKELNSVKEAETHCIKEKESCQKIERRELKNMLDMKKVRFSQEPPEDNENAINVGVRMPDGSRNERRFLKTDKLQDLFDFIDICGAVKPGTYRIVKSYPRCAYGINDGQSTLNEVGLSSKNEALFLELI